MDRRTFLAAAAAVAVRAPFLIVDTHIHLFDPRRPQGVPWPDRNDDALYRPALPDRYRALAAPFGITAAIAVECSPWVEDNQWLLDVAARDPIIVGIVGNLEPDKPGFARQLEKLHRNPLFLGIRYGNLWGRDLGAALSRPAFLEGLKLLAQAGLVLDTANPTPDLIAAVLRLTDRLPTLRVVIDHLAQLDPATVEPNLRKLAACPQVYVKGSAVPHRSRLDALYEIFGPARLIYGSDWPNSDHRATYAQVFALVKDYFEAKPLDVQRSFFYENSRSAYAWKTR